MSAPTTSPINFGLAQKQFIDLAIVQTKWNMLATGYISDVVNIVHKFTVTLLSAICCDDRVKRELISELLDELLLRYKNGVDATHFILNVEREGTPLTTNHYFTDNLEKR